MASDRILRRVTRQRDADTGAVAPPEVPFALPEDASALVRRRRVERRLKAGVAVVVAVAAGAFISCQRIVGNVEHDASSPTPTRSDADPDARPRPVVAEPPADPPLADTPDATPADAAPEELADAELAPKPLPDQVTDASADVPPDAVVPVDKPRRREPKVDVRHHRRGMPVIDNLVE